MIQFVIIFSSSCKFLGTCQFIFVSKHMTSLSSISNPAKHTYTDDNEYVAGIKPTMARYAEIGITPKLISQEQFTQAQNKQSSTYQNNNHSSQGTRPKLSQLKHGPTPASLFIYFHSFQTNNTIFTTNQCEKCPSSKWLWDSNPRPLEHESSPITTKPGLPPRIINCQQLFITCTCSRYR